MTTRPKFELSVLVAVAALAVGGSALAQSGSSTAKPAAKPAAPQTAKPAAPQTAKPATAKPAAPAAGPVIVVETERGTFEFETYPKEAPKTVAHITALVRRNFYNNQRIHRVEPGFVVQFGDPNTRDFTKQEIWGTGGSGKPIGAAEMNAARPHKVGAVAMAHAGDPSQADSQMYVALDEGRTRQLNGGYTVFGQVISGMDVVSNIRKNDMIKRMTIKGATPPPKSGTAPKPGTPAKK